MTVLPLQGDGSANISQSQGVALGYYVSAFQACRPTIAQNTVINIKNVDGTSALPVIRKRCWGRHREALAKIAKMRQVDAEERE